MCNEKKKQTNVVKLDQDDIVIPNLSIEAGEEAILPFHMNVGEYELVYAKVQPLMRFQSSEGQKQKETFIFFRPAGME